jgi:hypothetical protein
MLCPMLIPLCSILQRFAETFDYYSRPICAVITACLMPSGVFRTRNLAVETQNIQATLLGEAHSSHVLSLLGGIHRKFDR